MKKILFVMKMTMAALKNKIALSAIRRKGGKLNKVKKSKKTSVKKKIVKVGAQVKIKKGVLLKRSAYNPIIEPRLYPWESKATFNPSAFEANGKVNLVYRAIGDDDSSVLGYAGSYDGYTIIERPT